MWTLEKPWRPWGRRDLLAFRHHPRRQADHQSSLARARAEHAVLSRRVERLD